MMTAAGRAARKWLRVDSQRTAVKICVLGTRNLANELLAYALDKETKGACTITASIPDALAALAASPESRPSGDAVAKSILLIDCIEHDYDEVVQAIANQQPALGDDLIVAIYNVYAGWGIEEQALRAGVKGFFYKQDSLSLFLKGINAIMGREVWVSREILMRSAIRGLRKTQSSIQEQTGLSVREIEILRLLGSGASNEEIAQRLFISQNTVKTHLYNIFKKIHASSRLEAVAWTAKNL